MNKTKSLGILLAVTFLYAVYLSSSTSGSMHQILKPALAQDISSAIKKGLISYGNMATANARGNNSTMVSDKNLPINTLELKANEKNGVYTWVNKEGTNPVLNFKLNMDIALVNSEWSFNGTGPDGKLVTIAGKAIDVLRQHSDGTWRILIDNPWGTDLQMSV